MCATHGGHDALAAIKALNRSHTAHKSGIEGDGSRKLSSPSTSLLDFGRAYARPFFCKWVDLRAFAGKSALPPFAPLF